MIELSMSASDILAHMRNGATLLRGFADEVVLTLGDGGKIEIPVSLFYSLLDEHKIVSLSGTPNGFYQPT
jgi:hypothetical protein